MMARAGITVSSLDIPRRFHVVALDAVGSTNDEAKRLGHENAPDGTVVWAKRQDAGRGRHSRVWQSPEGNLYCSILLRPACPPGTAAQLSFVTALAVDDGLSEVLPDGVDRKLKWPNDVLLNGHKVAGILLEAETDEAGELAFVVIGIGVNVAHHPDGSDRPTTSLSKLGRECSVEQVLSALLRSFALWRDRWVRDGFAAIRAQWLCRTYSPGSPITVRLPRGQMKGRFAGLDAAGTLLVDIGQPAPQRITAGDVFFGSL